MNTPNPPVALIVDDNPENRVIFRVCLRSAGFKTDEASNGKEALLRLEKNSSIPLMVLDLQMPVMNGIEVLEYLTARPQYQALYIVVVTANAHMARGNIAGERANDILYKPVNIPEFTQFAQRLREQWTASTTTSS